MNDIKVIFIDIDGTLTDSNDEIRPNLITIIKKIIKKNIKVILVSGRNLHYAEEISKYVSATPIVIASNGAIVKNYDTNEIILKKTIPKKDIKKLYKYTSTHNCILNASKIDEDIIINNQKDITTDIVQVKINSTNYERMQIIDAYLKDLIPEIIVTNSSKSIYQSKRKKDKVYFHEIAKEFTSKGNAVLEVVDYLKIDAKDTMAIGDSNNDISMMLVCDKKIAMGNSTNKLKKYCDLVIDTNDNDGLYKFLKSLIDKSK